MFAIISLTDWITNNLASLFCFFSIEELKQASSLASSPRYRLTVFDCSLFPGLIRIMLPQFATFAWIVAPWLYVSRFPNCSRALEKFTGLVECTEGVWNYSICYC